MNIGHVVFGQNSLNYGLSLCLYLNKIQTQAATIRTAKAFDVILFSCFWWQHVIDFVDFCNSAGIGKHKSEKPYIIVGGFNSFNPAIFKEIAHAVVVGDGEDVIKKAINKESHPSIYTGIESSIVYNQFDISKNQFIYTNESKISRIEMARGCPYHCKFCQLSALKKYRELPVETLERIVPKCGKRIALFAPNKTSHSHFQEIKSLVSLHGKIDVVPDVRFNDVEKFYHGGTIQIGVEGISERLRYSVGKKMSTERYREIIEYVIAEAAQKKGARPNIHVGYILDLPGESDSDWNDFKNELDSFETIKGIEAFNLFFVFNLFMPSPFTPLEDAPINYNTEYQSKIKTVLKRDRRYKVAIHGRLFSNYSRVLSMITTRGGSDVPDILNEIQAERSIRALSDSKKVLPLKYILKNHGGIERFVGVPHEKPWKIVRVSHV